MIRVLIADDQELVRTGFRMILDAQEDIEVVGEAVDGIDVLRQVRDLHPDVVLLDIEMPRLDGLEVTERLLGASAAEPRVVILTTFDRDEYLYRALKAGATGFLLKDVPRAQLIHAIRAAAAGDELLSPSITRRLVRDFVRRSRHRPAELDALTPRELHVLELIARGRSNSQIAEELVLSEATIKTHVGHVFSKLGVRDRAQAVVFAYESGVVTPGDAGEG